MKMALGFLTAILITCFAPVAYASDPSPLQDFCVAVNDTVAADPPINQVVLSKAFQVEKKVIDYLQAQFRWNID
ncbi:hypothetical protein BUALT_Bualt04G0067200 [Buddleja alternifolia]|uniref:Uncharacterized protein n=1 Tax=Buddleja alternifolia TaxID=168488 RepID=A0AAV6XXG5_9LAMI|nr:hypothetical protein BUALT_Bualt04G0067200 [Buddleja alternifolia]